MFFCQGWLSSIMLWSFFTGSSAACFPLTVHNTETKTITILCLPVKPSIIRHLVVQKCRSLPAQKQGNGSFWTLTQQQPLRKLLNGIWNVWQNTHRRDFLWVVRYFFTVCHHTWYAKINLHLWHMTQYISVVTGKMSSAAWPLVLVHVLQKDSYFIPCLTWFTSHNSLFLLLYDTKHEQDNQSTTWLSISTLEL